MNLSCSGLHESNESNESRMNPMNNLYCDPSHRTPLCEPIRDPRHMPWYLWAANTPEVQDLTIYEIINVFVYYASYESYLCVYFLWVLLCTYVLIPTPGDSWACSGDEWCLSLGFMSRALRSLVYSAWHSCPHTHADIYRHTYIDTHLLTYKSFVCEVEAVCCCAWYAVVVTCARFLAGNVHVCTCHSDESSESFDSYVSYVSHVAHVSYVSYDDAFFI